MSSVITTGIAGRDVTYILMFTSLQRASPSRKLNNVGLSVPLFPLE